jgi:hypothetical protein
MLDRGICEVRRFAARPNSGAVRIGSVSATFGRADRTVL